MIIYYLKKTFKYLLIFIILNCIYFFFYKLGFFKEETDRIIELLINTKIKDYLFSFVFVFVLFSILLYIIFSLMNKNIVYIYPNGKKITKKNTLFYREIPCNGDIYLADLLLKMNKFGKPYNNIFTAVLLKWILNGNLIIDKEYFIVNKKLEDANVFEENFFALLSNRTIDNKLYYEDFKNSINDFKKVYNILFNEITKFKFGVLLSNGHVKIEQKSLHKYHVFLDDYIYEESKKLYGLKLFLHNFKNLDIKDIQDVYMWEKYLMFACILGETNNIIKQLKLFFRDSSNEFPSEYKNLPFLNKAIKKALKKGNTKTTKIDIKNM